MNWRTLLSFTWRESRFARRRLFLFLSSITLGVAALVAVQGFSAGISRGVEDQARALLGADLSLAARQPFGERTEQLLDSLQQAGVPTARATVLASMALAPRTGGTRLVQLRAVEPGFPFYGTIETEPVGRWESLHEGLNLLVDPALLVALDARVGDEVRLGEASFRILGVLRRVPGDVEVASSFAPRVYLPAEHLAATGLVDFGSRVDYEAYLQLAQPAQARVLLERYGPVLREERVRARTADQQQEMLGRTLTQLGDYLGLIGVLALLLGGIGVASAMRAYMTQKADAIAVLRCIGATSGQLFAVYLLQAAGMGLAGAALGVALGLALQSVLPGLLAGLLPVEVRLGVDAGLVGFGLAVGVWIAVVFALLPLLATRRVSPLRVLRRDADPLRAPRDDFWRWGAWAVLAASVLGLVVMQAGSLRVGAAFAGGIAVALLLLWALAVLAGRAARLLSATRAPYVVRQGIANLHRPGNQTVAVVVALGFGVFLLSTLLLTQHNLLRPLLAGDPATRPNLLLWDVQPDQQTGVERVLADGGHPVLQSAAIVPMRVAAINGRDVRRWARAAAEEAADAPPPSAEDGPAAQGPGTRRQGPEAWAVRREYRSTYRDTLVASEQLLEGRWWDEAGRVPGLAEAGSPPPVSLERDIARDLGVGVGDRVTWDVQGVELETVVASIREVDWARFEPNFFAVFPSAALADAPHTLVLLTRVADDDDRALAQRALVERFPNVAALDLTLVQQALDSVIERVSLAIRFLAGFSIATGFVVLLGAIATGRLQRIRESVLLRTLGASWRQIAAVLLSEYTLLGLLAAVVGAGLSVGAGWALATWLFGVPFAVPIAGLVLLALGVSALTAALGALASREVFRSTPLELIREE
jgi:putative ABC transport system permease protein